MGERKIHTYCATPATSSGPSEWSAWYEGDGDFGPYGVGETEEEAIADLKSLYPDEEPK